MENLNITLEHSLEKYFKVLSKIGYVSPKDVYNLLSLVIVTKLLKKYSVYVIACISGSCLIEAPTIFSEDSIFYEVKHILGIRITQDSMIRTTEDEIFRIAT